MNIKNRIEKLEKLGLSNSGADSCECWEKYCQSDVQETYDAYKEGREPDESKIYPVPKFKNNNCENCGKPVSPSTLNSLPDSDVMKMYEDFLENAE